MILREAKSTPGLMLVIALTVLSAGTVNAEPVPDQGPPTAAEDARININEAGVDALIALPGIGPSRAEAIVAERKKRAFRRVEDIMRVPGIGRKTYLRIRDRVRVR